MTNDFEMKKVQFTKWDQENLPKLDNERYLICEKVSTGLSTETCFFYYKDNDGAITKDEVIKRLQAESQRYRTALEKIAKFTKATCDFAGIAKTALQGPALLPREGK